jgi:hypothetical protein
MREVLALNLPGEEPAVITGPVENAAQSGSGFFAGMSHITLGDFITKLLPIIFSIAGILLFIYFLIASIHLIYSGGDPKAVESARNRIMHAIIGAAVISLAFLFIKFLQATLTIG